MRLVLWGFLVLGLCGAAYVRLAPNDLATWHVPIDGAEDADMAGGALRVIVADPDTLAKADAYMAGLPRTQVLGGSVAEDRITYITRSKVMGFPDYTTLEVADGTLKAYARLRFGGSDMGVNRTRLEGLLAALKG